MPNLESKLIDKLACPVDGKDLTHSSEKLVCSDGHQYPVIEGIPVMLPESVTPTLAAIANSRTPTADDPPYYLSSVLVSDEQRELIKKLIANQSGIDPVASVLVGATNGIGYLKLVGRLNEYPIPDIRLPNLSNGTSKQLLDIGCSWGRWTIAAARAGYDVVGIDPSLGAVLAARRIANQLGLSANFVVGDARMLPFKPSTFDNVFSYSVIQHFSKKDAQQTFQQVGAVLRGGGMAMIQMPTKFGIRCLYNQLRRGFSDGSGFEVRYWTLGELRKAFEDSIGNSQITVDCFFGIGWQACDQRFMPPLFKFTIALSELLRHLSSRMPLLSQVADSVYVKATKPF